MIKKHYKISWMLAIITFLGSGFVSILYFQFAEYLAFEELIFANALYSLFAVCIVSCRSKFYLRTDAFVGLFAGLIGFLFLLLPFSRSVFYAYFLLSATGALVFFIPLNILYFRESKKKKHLQHTTWYFVIGSLMGVLGPLLGTFLLERAGKMVFVGVAVSLFLFGLYCICRFFPKEVVTTTVRERFCELKGIRLLVAVDGAMTKLWFVLAIFAILYIDQPVGYGLYLAFMALTGACFGLLVAKFSDKYGGRKELIWVLSFLMAFVSFGFLFVETLFGYMVFVTVISFVNVFFESVRANILKDYKKEAPINWISRELYLNIGRVLLLMILALLVWQGYLREGFLLFTMMYVLFPFLVARTGLYGKATTH